MRTVASFLLAAALATPAMAQSQASTIQISRDAHDAAWVATGVAVTFTMKELGLSAKAAALVGGLGTVTLSKVVKCTHLCGKPAWPTGIVAKDFTYDIILADASIPILLGKSKGWKLGVASGAAWFGAALLLRQLKWNSP
ncbi:MAG: hypothetical protein AB7L66_17595 [Gemmatimonadales bacterium]